MKRKIIIFTIAALELIFLGQWLSCARLADQFHFSPFDLSLRLIEAIHNDGGMSLFIVRLFHNKFLGTAIDIYNNYANYWDFAFLIQLFSFVGVFGFLCSIWYIFRGKLAGRIWILFVVSLLMPIFEIILTPHMSFILRLVFLTGPLLVLSFMGWWKFLRKENAFRYGLFIALEMLSILWLFSVLLQANSPFCLK